MFIELGLKKWRGKSAVVHRTAIALPPRELVT
jgi:hypothetical protein